MGGYQQAQRSTTHHDRERQDNRAARNWPVQPPTTQPLLQFRNAMDKSPPVRHQAALQRLVDQGGERAPQTDETAQSGGPAPVRARPKATGLPENLKLGIEQISGLAMDDVRVHYNSTKPAAVQALAYTQGPDIHVAPGQEKHLPHEAWHVVQQKQGRVRPTLQLKGVSINDDPALEREADTMAGRIASRGAAITGPAAAVKVTPEFTTASQRVVQARKEEYGPLHEDSGTKMRAWIYGANDKSGGSAGTTLPSWWPKAGSADQDEKDAANYLSEAVVQGHLLNANLGGPGERKNLTPITRSTNTTHWHQAEKLVGEELDKDRVVEYFVEPDYKASIDPGGLQATQSYAVPTSQKFKDYCKKMPGSIFADYTSWTWDNNTNKYVKAGGFKNDLQIMNEGAHLKGKMK